MVLKTKSCNLLTVDNRSSPSAAMAPDVTETKCLLLFRLFFLFLVCGDDVPGARDPKLFERQKLDSRVSGELGRLRAPAGWRTVVDRAQDDQNRNKGAAQQEQNLPPRGMISISVVFCPCEQTAVDMVDEGGDRVEATEITSLCRVGRGRDTTRLTNLEGEYV